MSPHFTIRGMGSPSAWRKSLPQSHCPDDLLAVRRAAEAVGFGRKVEVRQKLITLTKRLIEPKHRALLIKPGVGDGHVGRSAALGAVPLRQLVGHRFGLCGLAGHAIGIGQGGTPVIGAPTKQLICLFQLGETFASFSTCKQKSSKVKVKARKRRVDLQTAPVRCIALRTSAAETLNVAHNDLDDEGKWIE